MHLQIYIVSPIIIGISSLSFIKYFWVNISVVSTVHAYFIHKQSKGPIYFPLMIPYICSFSVSIVTTYIKDFTTSPLFISYYWALTYKWKTPMQTTIPNKCYKGKGAMSDSLEYHTLCISFSYFTGNRP